MAVANRENDFPFLAFAQGRGTKLEEKLPGNVVESGSQISDTIPDYARESRRRLGCDDTFNSYDIALSFEDGLIRLCAHVPPAVFIERFQMLLSPDDFEPSAV
jgi:hypothetical protein